MWGGIDIGIVPEPLLPESELALLSDEVITLEVEFLEGVSEQEKEIVLGMIHRNRMDFNGRIIRSNSSRAYAQKAKAVAARSSNRKRSRYFVTIDNEKYARYSGELQILLDDFESDERVNIVGKISEKDQRFLSLIKEGIPFRFVEKAN